MILSREPNVELLACVFLDVSGAERNNVSRVIHAVARLVGNRNITIAVFVVPTGEAIRIARLVTSERITTTT